MLELSLITSGCQKVQLPSIWKRMGIEVDYNIGIPCVVQWIMFWFSAPTGLNGTLEKQDLKIVKYH